MFGSLGFTEIAFILILALLLFGPKRLPEIGKTLGKGLAEFRRASNELKRTLESEVAEEERSARRPAAPLAPVAPVAAGAPAVAQAAPEPLAPLAPVTPALSEALPAVVESEPVAAAVPSEPLPAADSTAAVEPR